MNFLTNRRYSSYRRGISLLESIGCVLAVVAGVWLGARVLGLDLQGAAYVALTEAELMEQLPPEWRPAPSADAIPLSVDAQESALRQELDEIFRDVAVLKEEGGLLSEVAFSATALPAPNLHPDLAARRQQTLAFWSRLGGVRAEINKLQQSAEEAVNEQNVYEVLEIRRRAYVYGAKAVEAAMKENNQVDTQAIQFASQLVQWYEGGAELYAEAIKVWQGQRLAPEGLATDEVLDQVRQQHDNEALLLFQKSDRLCEVLVRRYQVAFPEIENSSAYN